MSTELNKKLISDQERVNQILKKFPSNAGGGNNVTAYADDIRKAYTELMDFIDGKRGEFAARVHDAALSWINKNGLNLFALSKFLDVDSTILRRAGYTSARTLKKEKVPDKLEGKRSTWLPFNYAEKFAHLIAGMSCHELYFGMEGMTLLPHRFSALVELLKQSEDPDAVRAKLVAIAKTTCDVKSENYYKVSEDPKYGNMPVGLCKKRLDEICEDRYVPSESVVRNVPCFIRPRLDGLFTDAKVKPKTVTVLSISLMIGTSVDYFSAIDYLQKTRAYYYAPDGKKCVVGMKDHRWLRTVVALPEEIQNRVLKEMYMVVLPAVRG